MKKFLIFLTVFSGYSLFAQDKPNENQAWNQPTEVHINYAKYQTLAFAGVSKEGLLSLNTLPEKIVITIPDNYLEKINISFNKKGTSSYFSVSAGCKDKKTCETFSISDLVNGELVLHFHNDELIRIGNRSINPKKVTTDKPYVYINPLPTATHISSADETARNYFELPIDTLQLPIAPITRDEINDYIDCILCNNDFFPCKSNVLSKECLTCKTQQVEAEQPVSKDARCKKSENYVCEVDAVTGEKQWFKRNSNGTEVKIENTGAIHPIAGSDFILRVRGIDTVKYVANLQGESFFMEDADKLMNAFTGKAIPDTNKYSSNKLADSVESDVVVQLYPDAKMIKGKLLALDKVLEKFNSQFSSIDFNEAAYRNGLSNIQQGIKNCLNIPLGNSDEDLIRSLKLLVSLLDKPEYNAEFIQMIDAIGVQYKIAINKKTNRKLFYLQNQVPDDDRFSLTLKSEKPEEKLLDYNFTVKGGFKIDISSGIFINGLGSSQFILQKFNFVYRESHDSVVINAGIPKDTIIYSGKVNTISGNFIATNKRKLNYGAGFFAHAYRRSGKPFNWGLGIGVALNNTGEVTAMLGLSAMWLSGKGSRIAFTGGVAFGKVKKLSAVERDFEVKDEYKEHDNGKLIYANLREVPRFYEAGDASSINTYEKWQPTWFFGISYNFASFNVKTK